MGVLCALLPEMPNYLACKFSHHGPGAPATSRASCLIYSKCAIARSQSMLTPGTALRGVFPFSS
jgi:hypothetical protein